MHYVDSDKSLKHECGQFNDSLCYLCLPGTVTAFLSLTKEVVGLNTIFYKFCRFDRIIFKKPIKFHLGHRVECINVVHWIILLYSVFCCFNDTLYHWTLFIGTNIFRYLQFRRMIVVKER